MQTEIYETMRSSRHVVRIGPLALDGKNVVVIGGPCAIESREQFLEVADHIQAQGASLLRGGIFKMRTNPKSFQGLGSEAFAYVKEAKKKTGLPFISEITDPRQISDLMDLVDVFQVGTRNMYNYSLLQELAATKKPILLKRGLSATYEEWIKAAEYIEHGGNDQVILCERGIRTFETSTRNTLDLNAVAFIKAHTHFPILVDPSHGTGRPELIKPMSLAALAAGADGIMLETHPQPREALSDAHQALSLQEFGSIMTAVKKLLPALGKELITI